MTPEQQRLLDKANRSLQAARELNNTGFPEFATKECLLFDVLYRHSIFRS